MKKLKYDTFVGNAGHFDNEVDLACSEGLDGTEVDHIKPQKIAIVSAVGHGASRFADVAFQGRRGFSRPRPNFWFAVTRARNRATVRSRTFSAVRKSVAFPYYLPTSAFSGSAPGRLA